MIPCRYVILLAVAFTGYVYASPALRVEVDAQAVDCLTTTLPELCIETITRRCSHSTTVKPSSSRTTTTTKRPSSSTTTTKTPIPSTTSAKPPSSSTSATTTEPPSSSSSTTTTKPPSSSSSATTTEPPKATLSCASDAYLIQVNTLYKVNLKTGEREIISSTVGNDGGPINSLGYNIKENYMYGTQGKELIRILGDGTTEDVVELPVSANIGDFDADGQYWYSSGGTTWGRVDLAPGSPTYGQIVDRGTSTLGDVPTAADWAYTPAKPGYLYGVGVAPDGTPVLVRWSIGTHTWETVYAADGLKAVAFGGVMSTSDGVLYGSDNDSGGIFRFPIDDPKGASRTATGPAAASNDGTRCFLQPDSST
ncbi:hypothetical protein TOPH_02451 [Tolypocladium ophioglossoides CBS 100239]|uniref:DUF6923 domain-containing protein n=1 Tax=Tolypocladium ophioglossoides (strain CBS 100239) TaxID=1163406 RepID=A0A0L0NGM9_TOLOC|nr:hypothetical protein TOPH_02451 [Tolypocladium ophioglossoides CBS 100239]